MKLKDSIKFGFGLYLGWTIARNLDKSLGKVISKSTLFDKCKKFIPDNETNNEQNTTKRVVEFGPH